LTLMVRFVTAPVPPNHLTRWRGFLRETPKQKHLALRRLTAIPLTAIL
jgi:hypothetical protein